MREFSAAPPRGERAAPTLSARTQGGGGLGTDFDCDGGLVAFGGNNTAGPIDVATAQTAHALRADGFDASEDGTGRGTPIVPVQGVALRGRDGGATAELTGEVMTALRCGGGGGDKPHVLLPTIAFSAKNYGADALDDYSPTLRAGGFTESHANAGIMPAIAYRTTGNNGCYETGHVTACLNTASDPNQIALLHQWRVRRLMPVECERLQGFPDGYTDVPYGTRNWTPDGPRYKALGNSMAVNVMRWIGRRIEMVEAIASERVA